ncbi:MAG TPA: NAD(P)H-dependent oxidoreductase [Aquaticitalea sp.]|nr:NAD(P)H-dependent oxidoreductase [Aquaticitalea sp.]
MDIIERLKWRYATKKFDINKILSEEKLNILKEAFNLTATSFGLQTLKLLVIEDKTIRQQIMPLAFGQKQVVDASHLLVICIQDDISDTDVDAHFDNVNDVRNTPETILAPYRANLKTMMRDMTQKERQEWSIKQTYIALGNLMTVCAVEGIDSCPMEGFETEGLDNLLQLKHKHLKSVLLLPVGYRDETDMFAGFKKVRKEVVEAVVEL